jgi:hypothetical protein
VIKSDILANFPNDGIWYDYFTGDEITVKDKVKTINLLPGQFHILTTKKLEIPKLVKPAYKLSKPMGLNLFEVFPNPSADNLNIFVNYKDKTAELVQITFYDISGKKIGNNSFTIKGDTLFTQKDFNYPFGSGMYFCEIEQGSYKETKKIIIY